MATATTIDEAFRALADPTRRRVVERLGSGPATTSELARPFDMALPSFTQHLGVLEAAGMVTSSKAGRVRTYRLTPSALGPVDDWLGEQRELWTGRFDRMDALVEDLRRREPPSRPMQRPTEREERP